MEYPTRMNAVALGALLGLGVLLAGCDAKPTQGGGSSESTPMQQQSTPQGTSPSTPQGGAPQGTPERR